MKKKFVCFNIFKKKTKKWFKFILKIYLKNNNENFKNVCISFAAFKIKIRKIFDVFDEKQAAKKNSSIFNAKNIDDRIYDNVSKKS